MSAAQPTTEIEPFRAADAQVHLLRHWPLNAFARFTRGLPSQHDTVHLSLSFGHDPATGAACAQGRLQCRAETTCERCLGPLALELDVAVRVLFGRTDDELRALDGHGEALAIRPGELLDLAWLAEEELLLAFPLVPRHASPQLCDPTMIAALHDRTDPARAEADHPFAALGALKPRHTPGEDH